MFWLAESFDWNVVFVVLIGVSIGVFLYWDGILLLSVLGIWDGVFVTRDGAFGFRDDVSGNFITKI